MSIRKIEIESCPYCGGKRFTKGQQDYYGQVHTGKLVGSGAQAMFHIFCTECGSVVRSFVFQPGKLTPYPPEE